LCREHGQQLSELAASSSFGEDFGFWGIVKETGVDDEGLLEFYKDYFTFPLYRDEKLLTYAALGNRWISLKSWNPIKIWSDYRSIVQRTEPKNIKGNLAGEGLVQGGVFVFDSAGVLKYAYEEDTGFALEMEDLKAALDNVRVPTKTPEMELLADPEEL
jgi:hypothetical protein